MSDATSNETIPRWDILVAPHDLGLRVPVGMGQSVIMWLAGHRYVRPYDEAVADTWAEVYMKPDAAAHDIFTKGVADSDEPAFLEMMYRFGTKRIDMPYGVPGAQIATYLEIRGARYAEPLGRFRSKLAEVMKVRPQIYVREHEALPPHLEVPPGEEPKNRRLERNPGGGLAGTRVEEW